MLFFNFIENNFTWHETIIDCSANPLQKQAMEANCKDNGVDIDLVEFVCSSQSQSKPNCNDNNNNCCSLFTELNQPPSSPG